MVWQDLCDEIAFDVSGDMSEPLVPKLSSPNDTNSSDSNSDWYCSASTNRGKFKWFCELCLSFQPKRRSNPYAAFQPGPEQTKLCLNCQIGSFLVKINLSTNEVVKRAYRCHVDEQHVDQVIRCQSHADDDDDDDDYSYDDDDDESDDHDDSDDDDDDEGIRRHRPDCGSKVSDSSHSCPLSHDKIAETKTFPSVILFPSNLRAVGKPRSVPTFRFPCDRLYGCAWRQPKTS